jgi:hypothetical protein
MRFTMRIRLRLWLHMLDRILTNKSTRLGFWALRVLDGWDRYLNPCAPAHLHADWLSSVGKVL